MKALENVEIEYTQIYGYIESSTIFSGGIELSINSNYVSETITITEDDCYHLNSIFYGQDYYKKAGNTDLFYYTNISPSIEYSEDYKIYYLNYISSDTSEAYSDTTENLNTPSEGSYIINFQASFGSAQGDRYTNFYICNENDNAKNPTKYLLKISTKIYSSKADLDWTLNDSNDIVIIPKNYIYILNYMWTELIKIPLK